jgi:hypothetical protein
MHHRVALLLLPSLAACAWHPLGDAAPIERVGTIDVGGVVGDAAITGVSRDPSTTHLNLLVAGRGIVEIDDDGALVVERRFGEGGLIDGRYGDLAALGSERFYVVTDTEGWEWNGADQTMTVAFCAVPELGDARAPCEDAHGRYDCDTGYPVDVDVVQRNDALGFQTSVVLAPRYDDEHGARVRANIYGGGSVVDITDLDVDLGGIAWLREGQRDLPLGYTAVDATHLLRLDLEGGLVAARTLDVGHAGGLEVEGDEAFVVDDDAHEIAIYDLSELPIPDGNY